LPLLEAVSLLTTLANAYQLVKGSKTATDHPGDPAETSISYLVLASDLVRDAANRSFQQVESVRSRLQALIVLSGLSLIGAPLIVRAGNGGADLDSALFLVALSIFGFIAGLGALVRNLDASSRVSAPAIEQELVYEPNLQLLDAMLKLAQATAERNQRQIEVGNLTLLLLSLVFVAQIVLLAIWIPSVS
jgi:hypothetical protein